MNNAGKIKLNSNFKMIGGFGIAEKEISKRKINIEEVIDKYHSIGIEEFFIGYNPKYWHEKFAFSYSPNGRFGENEQVSSFNTFKKAVEYVHSLESKKGVPCEIYLTINNRSYNDITFPLIKRIIGESIEIGVDGLIVGNFETLQYLGKIGYKGRVHISTIMNIYNQDSIEYYIDYCKKKKLDLHRLILPREVTLSEIKYLTNKFPNNNFEVFGQGDYCRYANGNCFAEHKITNRDICSFILKNGLEIKKRIRYDFKSIVLDGNKGDWEKQELLNPELNTLETIFSTNTIVSSNKGSEIIEEVLDKLENNFYGNEEEKRESLLILKKQIIKELNINEDKYIWDGMRNHLDSHNKRINLFLRLWDKIQKDFNYQRIISFESHYKQKIEKIKKQKEKGIKYFNKIQKERGEFGLETYYKFLLYNRTSVPFYKFFHDIKNIKVVKIPLRGRDPSIFRLGIDLINDALKYPEKYINDGNILGKNFHYDNKVINLNSN